MRADVISDAIERAAVLDKPADALVGLVKRVLPAGPVKDALSGVAIGHPAHPLAVTVPIGSWVSASLLDLVGGPGSRSAARTLVGAGALAALPAVASGVSYWVDTSGPERRVGAVHAATNATALTLYVASWGSRRRGRHSSGVRSALLGAGVLAFGGWLGGHLAYALGVGVDTTAFLSGPAEWTDVAADADVMEGRLVGVTVGVTPVLVLRHHGQVVAFRDRCTHRGGALHEGRVVDGCVECPLHGTRISIADGDVVRGPATRPQPRLEVRLREGRVEVRQTGEQRALRLNPVASGNA